MTPDDLRAVHFDLDPIKTEDLTTAWRNLGFARLPLDIVECPDRRIPRAAAEVVATALADGETEVSVLLPRRQYTHMWHRFLHDRTANTITQALSVLPHSNVTIVPYRLGSRPDLAPRAPKTNGHRRWPGSKNGSGSANGAKNGAAPALPDDCTPIASIEYRQRARVAGKVHTMHVQPHGGVGASSARSSTRRAASRSCSSGVAASPG